MQSLYQIDVGHDRTACPNDSDTNPRFVLGPEVDGFLQVETTWVDDNS